MSAAPASVLHLFTPLANAARAPPPWAPLPPFPPSPGVPLELFLALLSNAIETF